MTDVLDKQIEKLKRLELISEEEVKDLCEKAREIFIEESNVQHVDAPVTVSPTTLWTQSKILFYPIFVFHFNTLFASAHSNTWVQPLDITT